MFRCFMDRTMMYSSAIHWDDDAEEPAWLWGTRRDVDLRGPEVPAPPPPAGAPPPLLGAPSKQSPEGGHCPSPRRCRRVVGAPPLGEIGPACVGFHHFCASPAPIYLPSYFMSASVGWLVGKSTVRRAA